MTKVFLMITGIFLFTSVYAQMKVGKNVKTIAPNVQFQIESDQNQQIVVSKDSGKLGIGTLSPSNSLHIVSPSNPLRIEGLKSGTINTDSILVSDSLGVVRQISQNRLSSFLNSEPWYNTSTNIGATSNTQNIYQMGDVGIGVNNPTHPLHVNGTIRAFNITNGSNSIGANNDLGLYSQFSGAWIRYVTTNSFHRWYTDGGDGTTAMMTLYNNGNFGIGNGNQGSIIPKFLVNDASYITTMPGSSANLMDGFNFRPHTRFQTMSGINNNALSIYSTTTAFGLQSHNFSTGASLPLLLQPAGGNVGIGIGGGSSPVARLHLISNDDTRTLYAQNLGGGVGTEPALKVLYNANSSARDIANFESLAGIVMNLRTDGLIGILQPNPSHPIHHGTGACLTSSGVWTNASDKRLKSNIIPSNYGLKEVMQLNPVNYTMNADKSKQVGLIAQEVQKIIPEVVSGKEGDISKGETLGVSYGNLVPVLINAIKELKLEIEELKKSIKNK